MASGQHNKYERRQIRRYRIRNRVTGSAVRPRLSVFRSSTHIYAQIVDDTKGITIVQASSRDVADFACNFFRTGERKKTQNAIWPRAPRGACFLRPSRFRIVSPHFRPPGFRQGPRNRRDG